MWEIDIGMCLGIEEGWYERSLCVKEGDRWRGAVAVTNGV